MGVKGKLDVTDAKENKLEDDEDIIRKFMDEDVEVQKQVLKKDKEITKKKKKASKDLGVKFFQVILVVTILLLIISLFSPWFEVGGEGALLGYAGEISATETLLLSPMTLVSHTLKNFDTYQSAFSENGSKTSYLSLLHIGMILCYLILLALASIAIVCVFARGALSLMRFVKVASILSAIVLCLNLFFMKVTYVNLFVHHSQSVLKMQDILNGVSIKGNGLQVNRQFYPYTISFTNTLFYALGFAGLWILISSVLLEIKRKRDEDLREIELKTSLKR